MGPLWVMGQWSIDCGCCHIVMRFVKKKKKKWFWSRIWHENAYNFLVISSLLHDWLSVLEHTGHMWACWVLGSTGCLGFSNNPCKMMRTRSDRDVHTLLVVPVWTTSFSVALWAPPVGHIFKCEPDFHFSFVFGAFCSVCLTVSLARVHSCTRISSTLLNLAVPSLSSFPHPAAQRGRPCSDWTVAFHCVPPSCILFPGAGV